MRSFYPVALSVAALAVGSNGLSLTKRQAEEKCASQCGTFATNFDKVQSCGPPSSPPTQETLQCLCKPELFSSFESCGQCLLDTEPTLESYCETESVGATLNQLAIICTNAGIKIDVLSFTTPPGFKPSDCKGGGSAPSGSAPGGSQGPAPTGSAGAGQPSPVAPSPIPSLSSEPSRPSSPASAGNAGASGSGSAPAPSASQSEGGNGAMQNALSWLSLGAVTLVGAFLGL